jgi:hypothetical protein
MNKQKITMIDGPGTWDTFFTRDLRITHRVRASIKLVLLIACGLALMLG